MKTTNPFDSVTLLIEESLQYKTLSDLEKFQEEGGDFSAVPLWPLYFAIQNTAPEEVAQVLPKLSKKQRQLILDIDLWSKDDFDLEQMNSWLSIYSLCPDQRVVQDFAASESFKLFLKSRCNVYTFDLEHPVYPDHDNHFITDDNQFLIEFDKNFESAEELRFLLRHFYAVLGIETANFELLKIINETHSFLAEECYHFKKERLRDIGYVDYFDAIDFRSLRDKKQVDLFIKKRIAQKEQNTGALSNFSLNQSHHADVVRAYQKDFSPILQEMSRVTSEKRQSFLQFSFMRTINATLSLENAFHAGAIKLKDSSENTKKYMLLGMNYLSGKAKGATLDTFDFVDLYKVGYGMRMQYSTQLKELLKNDNFEEKSEFLGETLNKFIDSAFDDSFAIELLDQKVKDLNLYLPSLEEGLAYTKMLLPLMAKLQEQIIQLSAEGKIHDNYYQNYSVEEIDGEAILVTLFINYTRHSKTTGMGVSLSDFKLFLNEFFVKGENSYELKDVGSKVDQFVKNLVGAKNEKISKYITYLLKDQFEEINFDDLGPEDYRHIGGVILLAF